MGGHSLYGVTLAYLWQPLRPSSLPPKVAKHLRDIERIRCKTLAGGGKNPLLFGPLQ